MTVRGVGAGAEFRAGWATVLSAAIGVCLGTTGLGFYAIALFVKPLAAEFGWGRGTASGAALCLQAGIVLTAVPIGRLVDRIGARRIALASLAAFSVALAALALLGPSIPLFYAMWLIVSLAGAGTTPVIWTRAVAARFVAARGIALGLTLMGTGIAAILVPGLLGPIFVAHGWRAGSLAMAAAVALIALPTVALLFRDAPVQPVVADRPRAVLGRAFGLLAVAFPLIGMIVAGLLVHLVALLTDRGMTGGQAVATASLVGFAVILGRVVVGALVDRIHAPYVAFAFLMLPVASCALLLGHGPVVPAVLLIGLAAGAEIDLLAYLVGRYFAFERYGATYGTLLAIFSFGAGLGPVLFGVAFDKTGGYDLALAASAVGMAFAATLIGRLGPYPTDPA